MASDSCCRVQSVSQTARQDDHETPDRKQEIHEAELRKLNAEARLSVVEAENLEMDVAEYRAEAQRHGIYHFVGPVSEQSVKSCIEDLDKWGRRDPGCDFTLTLNTPGGDVIDGLALYDFITQDLRENRQHKVTTVARGYAASMGGILLQAGDKRLIGKNAYVLIHEVSSGAIGKVSELEDEFKFTKRLQERLVQILAERSTLTEAGIKKKWSRKDWWVDSAECVDLGLADGIG